MKRTILVLLSSVAFVALMENPAYASGNNNGPECVGNGACATTTTNTTNNSTTNNQGGTGIGVGVGIGKGGDARSSSHSGAIAGSNSDSNARSNSDANSNASSDQGQSQSINYNLPRNPVNSAFAPSMEVECQTYFSLGAQGRDAGLGVGIPISGNWCRKLKEAAWVHDAAGKQAAIRYMCLSNDTIAEAIGEEKCNAPDTPAALETPTTLIPMQPIPN